MKEKKYAEVYILNSYLGNPYNSPLLFTSRFNTAIQETSPLFPLVPIYIYIYISPPWLCRTHRYAAQTRPQYDACSLHVRSRRRHVKETFSFLITICAHSLDLICPAARARASLFLRPAKVQGGLPAYHPRSVPANHTSREITSLSNILTHRGTRRGLLPSTPRFLVLMRTAVLSTVGPDRRVQSPSIGARSMIL